MSYVDKCVIVNNGAGLRDSVAVIEPTGRQADGQAGVRIARAEGGPGLDGRTGGQAGGHQAGRRGVTHPHPAPVTPSRVGGVRSLLLLTPSYVFTVRLVR